MVTIQQVVLVLRSRLLLLLSLFCGLAFPLSVHGVDPVKEPPLEKTLGRPVRVLFDDAPSVDQLGFFVAKENGYYERAGFKHVEFVWNNGSTFGLESVGRKEIDFAAFWMSEGIAARAKKVPVVALALICQGSTACFITRNDVHPHLVELDSLQNQRVSIWGCCRHMPKAFLTSRDIMCNYVNQRSNVAMLLTNGGADAIFSTTYDFAVMGRYLLFRDSMRLFRFSAYGCNYPELALFCHESTLQSHPEACRRFMLATWQGWKAAFDDPDKAVKILSKHCDDEGSLNDLFIMREQFAVWRSAMGLNPDLEKNGDCDKQRFESLCRDMVKAKLIEKKDCPRYEDMFFPVQNRGFFSLLIRRRKAPKTTEPGKEMAK